MKDVTPARFSLFAAGINKPSSQRPYKQGTLAAPQKVDTERWKTDGK